MPGTRRQPGLHSEFQASQSSIKRPKKEGRMEGRVRREEGKEESC